MMTQITEAAARRSRIAMTRGRLRDALRDSLSSEERAEYQKVRAEIEADTDLDQDPVYAPLLQALIQKVGRRRAYEVLFTPERFLDGGTTYPLYNEEVERLLRALGADCDARTIERMVEDGVIPQPPQMGGGSLPRNAYFARHLLAAAYRALLVPEGREELRVEARVARGQVSPEAALLLRTLPGVNAAIFRRQR